MTTIIKNLINHQSTIIDKILMLISLIQSKNKHIFYTFVLSTFFQVLPLISKYLKYRKYKYRIESFNLSKKDEAIDEIYSIKLDGKLVGDSKILIERLLSDYFPPKLKFDYMYTIQNKMVIFYKNAIVKVKLSPKGFYEYKLYSVNKEYANFICENKSLASYKKLTYHPGNNEYSYKIKLRYMFNENLYPCYHQIMDAINSWKKHTIKHNMLGGNKLCFLFEGPPGCGKTLLGRLMARIGGYKTIAELSIKKNKIIAPVRFENAVLIFDDIDILCSYNRKDGYDSDKSVIFDSLMKFLDSESINNCIIVLTSNNITGFDNALFRPGRVDYHIKFGPLDFNRIKNFLSEWYGIDTITNLVEKDMTSAKMLSIVKHNIDNFEGFKEEWNNVTIH